MNSLDQSNKFAKNLKLLVLDMLYESKGMHIGSIFSCIDIISVIFSNKISKKNKNKFILSKGHAGCALYAALAINGIISKKYLKSYLKNGSLLSGHISHKNIDGIDFSTGSLGHGCSYAVGLALKEKIYSNKNEIFCLLGDGECQEGSVWESVMFASHHNLKNLTFIVDRNNIQGLDNTEKIISLGDLKKKFEAFGFGCFDVDGHNHKSISKAINHKIDRPKAIISNTIKAKYIPFLEGKVMSSYTNLSKEQYIELKKLFKDK